MRSAPVSARSDAMVIRAAPDDFGDAAGDAGEDRRLALGVGARLAAAQAFDQVQEVARVVRLEGDDELLVVQAERVAGVDLDSRELVADADVLVHGLLALLERQAIPRAAS